MFSHFIQPYTMVFVLFFVDLYLVCGAHTCEILNYHCRDIILLFHSCRPEIQGDQVIRFQ